VRVNDAGDEGIAVSFHAFSPGYTAACDSETDAIRDSARPARMFIDHVGSTAVQGLGGKPVIDLLIALQDWAAVDRVVASLATLGYVEQEALGEPPRRFLIRANEPGPDFNVHLTPLDSEWGRDMLVFRDELSADPELARRYASLKERLAARYGDDLSAYTRGKNEFVGEVLRRAAGAFAIDRLLTHQRAEFDRSQRYQGWAILAQLGVAVVAAVSVYSNDNRTQLNFALIGFLLAALWLWLVRRQRDHRSAGDQARRVALLTSGLGAHFSAKQRLRIFDRFTVPIEGRKLQREEVHFASRMAHGYERLAELVEESAYWTLDLQRTSAAIVQGVLLAIAAVLAASLWMGLLTLPTDTTVSVARVLIAVLVFLLSSDVIGIIFAHREATATIAEILQRVETAAARGFPEADALLLMSDYNAAVESAPFALPFVFKLRDKHLTRRWRNYLENKRR